MKLKTIISISLFTILSFSVKSQDAFNFPKMIVTKFLDNGFDYSKIAVEHHMILTFYESEGAYCFMNLWGTTSSYSLGKIYDFKSKNYPETETTYAATEVSFLWRFTNSYDEESGSAKVTIIYTTIDNVVTFNCEMVVLETKEVLQYEGYRE